MLSTWTPRHTISPSGFVAFIKSVLNGLPSSSSKPPVPSPMVSIFGEHLVDMIWAVDAELDEILGDAKTAITNCGESSAGHLAAALSRAKKAKQNAENDKEILTQIVKQLLVCHLLRCMLHRSQTNINRTSAWWFPHSVSNGSIQQSLQTLDSFRTRVLLTRRRSGLAQAYCASCAQYPRYSC
jgi:hypothetical protein